jgi:hypothetical protein
MEQWRRSRLCWDHCHVCSVKNSRELMAVCRRRYTFTILKHKPLYTPQLKSCKAIISGITSPRNTREQRVKATLVN